MSNDKVRREKLQRIRESLGKAFEGYTITERDLSPGGEPVFRIERGDSSYELRVDPDLLDDTGSGAIDGGQIASELRRAEGLPMILTAAGIRLASSN